MADSFTQTPAQQAMGASDFEMALRTTGHEHDFANFSPHPPKPLGTFRQFSRRSKYRAAYAQSRDKLAGSNSNLCASLSGSSQSLLDPAKMMNMQDDARSRRISSEVMKHRLYESVITSPRRRRFSMRLDCYGSGSSGGGDVVSYARMVQSVPVTPAHSETVTPVHSPTTQKRFMFGFFSRGTTPRGTTPDEEVNNMEVSEEENCKGLASLFRPQPRFIRAHHEPVMENGMEVDEEPEDSRDMPENRLRGYPGAGTTGFRPLYQQAEMPPPAPLQMQQQFQQPDDVFLQPLARPKPRRRPPPLQTDQDTRPTGF